MVRFICEAAGIPLSKENASYVVDAVMGNFGYGMEYNVVSEQIVAKQWGESLVMALVITDANGVDHCSGVISYGPSVYAHSKIDDTKVATIDDVCRWLLAYSQRAIIYLNK